MYESLKFDISDFSRAQCLSKTSFQYEARIGYIDRGHFAIGLFNFPLLGLKC